ncbi:MAG: TolC family protein, partial [Synergistaceae bacterium]|nr:TolC family protein [Synergistaceae bacterium]
MLKKRRCFFLISVLGTVVFGMGRPALPQPLSIDLDKAFELALGSDKGIKAAESDVVKANEGRRQARGTRNVTLKIEHDTVNIKYQNDNDMTVNSFQNVVSATYPLYTGGMIEGSIAASEYELKS